MPQTLPPDPDSILRIPTSPFLPLAVVPDAGITVLAFVMLALLILSFILSGAEVAIFSLRFKDINFMKTKQRPSDKRILALLELPRQLMASLSVADLFVNMLVIVVADHVVDAMAADGIDVMLAGHTHGGQVRIPGLGALVTNCDLDRRQARGLSRVERPLMEFAPHDRPDMWLHVSAGLGTSPYAPIRFACPPEATLLTLTARG